MTALALRDLTLTNFRNYQSLNLEFPASDDAFAVVLTGDNGAGKTNLLEAVSLLTAGRGLRGAKLNDLPHINRTPASAWGIAANADGRLGPVRLGTGQEGAAAENKRQVRIDGETVSAQTRLADHLVMAWLTPAMDGLFREGSSERRRFVDRLTFAFDPSHAGRVTRYEKLLRERAKLLREARENGTTPDATWLDSLEAGMAETATAISAGRLGLIERLNRVSATALDPFPAADLALEGAPERWLADGMAAGMAEDKLREALNRSRRADSEAGGAETGPHKTDLLARHRLKDMPAHLCSTGEQKALLLAITLAHARLVTAEIGHAPILLLDEVAAHLDEARREALYDRLAAHGAQVWITGTDANIFNALGNAATHLIIRDGAVQKGA
ncbi:MAG: DNA replication/repair protein RecF [Alphaproteobacteria bacterium]|nr:DNA replication/repair protein RecF [Alphaproteobacteria bacterium SS10]